MDQVLANATHSSLKQLEASAHPLSNKDRTGVEGQAGSYQRPCLSTQGITIMDIVGKSFVFLVGDNARRTGGHATGAENSPGGHPQGDYSLSPWISSDYQLTYLPPKP